MLLDPNGRRLFSHGSVPDLLAVYRCQAISQANAAFLASTSPETVHKVVYVCQQEYAVTNTAEEDANTCFASADATTCIVLALHCPKTNNVLMAHIDSPRGASAALLSGMECPNAYLIGAYNLGREARDTQTLGTLLKLLHVLDAAPQPVHLKLACVYDFNVDAGTGGPLVTAMGLEISTGRAWLGVWVGGGRGVCVLLVWCVCLLCRGNIIM